MTASASNDSLNSAFTNDSSGAADDEDRTSQKDEEVPADFEVDSSAPHHDSVVAAALEEEPSQNNICGCTQSAVDTDDRRQRTVSDELLATKTLKCFFLVFKNII